MRHITVRARVPLALAALGLLSAGCGGGGHEAGHASEAPAAVPGRTVTVTMTDHRFDPGTIEVSPGETIRLRFVNAGTVTHEALVGSASFQTAHQGEMEDGHGHGDHDDLESAGLLVELEPGREGELTVTVDGEEPILIGCHQPGHWEAGMQARLVPST